MSLLQYTPAFSKKVTRRDKSAGTITPGSDSNKRRPAILNEVEPPRVIPEELVISWTILSISLLLVILSEFLTFQLLEQAHFSHKTSG